MEIKELPTRMVYGEVRMHVDLQLLDDEPAEVLDILREMGYQPELIRYNWQPKESPDQSRSCHCALLFRSIVPGGGEALFDALQPLCEQLEQRFPYAVTLVRAGGKNGHLYVPPTERYKAPIAA